MKEYWTVLTKCDVMEFIPPLLVDLAYRNIPLSILGHDQVICQPSVIASMAQAAEIKATDKVLEIGSGSGYNAAILSNLAQQVYTTEIVEELHNSCKKSLDRLGYKNVESELVEEDCWPA